MEPIYLINLILHIISHHLLSLNRTKKFYKYVYLQNGMHVKIYTTYFTRIVLLSFLNRFEGTLSKPFLKPTGKWVD